MSTNDICIIVPCYNEAKRIIERDFLEATQYDILFVDDASQDESFSIIQNLSQKSKNISLLKLNKNVGKSEAIRQGFLKACSSQYTWIAYLDCDLSTTITEFSYFLKYNKELYDNKADVIIGSRIKRAGSVIERRLIRHFIGRAIMTLCWLLMEQFDFYDTQCGAKIFKNTQKIQNSFATQFKTNWLFDIELLFRLKKEKASILEYPLRKWIDKKGSKVTGVRNYLQILRDLWILLKD